MQSIKHEQSNMDASDMSELIKAAKAQQIEKSKKLAEEKKHQVPNKNTVQVTNTSDLSSVEHGSYVETEDGVGGIVIDHDVELERIRENDETGQKLIALLDENSIISDVNAYVPDYGEEAPEGYDPGVEYIKNNPYDPKVRDMMKIKEGFSKLTFGLPGHGLVDANSEEGKRVTEALDKLRTGEIVLPTAEEYEAQKKAAAERRAKRMAEQNNQQEEVIDTNYKAIEEKEIEMAEMPENAIMKKGVDDLLNEINGTNNINEVGGPVPMNRIDLNDIEEPTNEEVKTPEPPHVVLGQPIVPPKPPVEEQTPINLAGLEEELDAEAHGTMVVNKPVEPEIKPEEVVTINVPEGEADTLIQNLPLETYDKVVKAKVVKVNEIELKDVPTRTTRITDIESYRRLTQRRPSINTAEITERVLINSGFVVTLKAATSLEMATIFSASSSDIDWEKEYTFCYEHTVGTSIGKLSYNEFVSKVSPSDIETILFGIYEISETDTRKVSIICGTNDGGCGKSYEVDTEINKLPNYDALNDRSKERIKKIVAAKNSLDESRRIAKDSPTTLAKYVECGDRILTVRATTGNMMIERVDRIDEMAATYNPIIALLMLYVENIRITYREREDAPETSFLIDTVGILCEELLKLTDQEIEFIKDIITNDLEEYPTVTFSIKGPCICPHCGNVKDSIECSVSDLVFQKAQSVLA